MFSWSKLCQNNCHWIAHQNAKSVKVRFNYFSCFSTSVYCMCSSINLTRPEAQRYCRITNWTWRTVKFKHISGLQNLCIANIHSVICLCSYLTYNIWCCWSLAVACGGLSARKQTTPYITPWQWTTCTHPGCRNWGRRSRRRSRCGVPAPTCCWRCERSWTPADKYSRRAGTWAEARWRSPAMLSESGPPTLVSIGSTWNRSR